MNRPLQSGCRILRQIFLFLFLISPPIQAIVDTNNNTLSDLWEQSFNNGSLFPNIDPQADPDADSWTNAQEAAAGTNPFDPNPPAGFLRANLTTVPAIYTTPPGGGDPIILTPETHVIAWPARWGKQYTLYASSDLAPESWLPVGDPILGEDNEIQIASQPGDPAPDRFFWRVAVTDADTDTDGLTNAEEHQLNTNPDNPDTDGDSLTDAQEIALTTNPTNPDTDCDGLTDGQEVLLGTNPKIPDNPGILQEAIANGNFSDPTIGTGARATEPPPLDWDYWAGIPGWTAVGGTHIEIQTIESTVSGDPYCELKAHPDGHNGIKQKIGTRKDVTYLLVLDCKDRADTMPGSSDFDIKINGTTVKSITFAAPGPWTTRAVSFKASSIITELSLVPAAPGDTLGCLVDNIRLAPVAIEDNIFATGVDNISITANPSDIGYQDKFWIMAPCGGPPYSDDMHFKIPLSPAADLKIESANATPDPATTSLSTATPSPIVTWRGNGAETIDDTPVWKIGPAQDTVELPIRVKTMKKRTVKVAVYRVHRPGSRDFPVFDDSAKETILSHLNTIFAYQLNAWLELTYIDVNYAYDTNSDGLLTIETPEETEFAAASVFTTTNNTHDIKVLLIDDIRFANNVVGGSGYLPIKGRYIPYTNTCIIAYGLWLYNSSNQLVLYEPTPTAIGHTMAHEIGHVMLGTGHPDNYRTDRQWLGGVAPLQSLNDFSDYSKRLMCSGQNSMSNYSSRHLVKSEWDAAETWLKNNPDKRWRREHGITDQNIPTGNY